MEFFFVYFFGPVRKYSFGPVQCSMEILLFCYKSYDRSKRWKFISKET